MPNSFSLRHAIEAVKDHRIDVWVYDFLRGLGGNKAMALGLKKRKQSGQLFWVGPIFFPLKALSRCCGPEDTIEYPQPPKQWETRVKRIMKSIKAGWECPILIANPRPWPILSVRDGNHRHEALRRMKKRKYWTLFWFEDKKECLRFMKQYKIKNEWMNISYYEK